MKPFSLFFFFGLALVARGESPLESYPDFSHLPDGSKIHQEYHVPKQDVIRESQKNPAVLQLWHARADIYLEPARHFTSTELWTNGVDWVSPDLEWTHLVAQYLTPPGHDNMPELVSLNTVAYGLQDIYHLARFGSIVEVVRKPESFTGYRFAPMSVGEAFLAAEPIRKRLQGTSYEKALPEQVGTVVLRYYDQNLSGYHVDTLAILPLSEPADQRKVGAKALIAVVTTLAGRPLALQMAEVAPKVAPKAESRPESSPQILSIESAIYH